ncbi:unnamed protein product [Ectocarpus sp. 12 AP-2014]
MSSVMRRTVGPLRGQIQWLKRSYWVGGVAGAARKAEEINRSQEPYWNIVRLLPPLPDFVIAFKRFKRPRELPRKLEQPAGCSASEQKLFVDELMAGHEGTELERRYKPSFL